LRNGFQPDFNSQPRKWWREFFIQIQIQ
jgi:hypothetical protein